MLFIHQIMLYFCTAVCALYLISGGYSVIRNYFQRKIDERAAEKSVRSLHNRTTRTCHNTQEGAC